MLGTGKGFFKSPDVILEGSGVGPQHCFSERLKMEEVILHPISELTAVDGIRLSGPTPLQEGNVISIGNSHLFRFEKTPSPEISRNDDVKLKSNSESESPYATIIRKGTPQVRKHQTQIMGSIMESSGSYHPHQHNYEQNGTGIQNRFLRQASFDDDYYDNSYASGPLEQNAQKFRDGLENDKFGNKLARFEFLTNQAGNESNQNGGLLDSQGRPQLPPINERRVNGFPKSLSSAGITDTIRRKPSPYFSRFGTNSEFRYYNEETEHENYILHSKEAVPTIGYRRAFSTSSALPSPLASEAIPFIRSNSAEGSKNQSEPKPNIESSQSCNSLSLCQSSPSPDSLYSSHSSNSSYVSYGNRSLISESKIEEKESRKLTPTRASKQIEDEGHFSSRGLLSNIESPGLDEVLAICEEYGQQIAREIQGKRPFQNSTGKEDGSISRNPDNCSFNEKLLPLTHSFSNRNSPDESKNNSTFSEAGNLNVKRYEFHECKNQHIKSNSPDVQLYSEGFHELLQGLRQVPENGFFSKIPTLSSSKELNQTFQDIFLPNLSTDEVDGQTPRKTFAQIGQENGSLPPELPPKSKLSVSFSPSVEEYNIDDPLPRVSSASNSPKSNTELTSKLKSHSNGNGLVVKTVATKAEVHDAAVKIGAESNPKIVPKPHAVAPLSPTPVVLSTAPVEPGPIHNSIQFPQIETLDVSSATPMLSSKSEDQISHLKTKIRDVEEQEVEALRDMEMEKALLMGEEESLDSDLIRNKKHLEDIRNRLGQVDAGFRLWKLASSQELIGMQRRLAVSERNLQRLEKLHEGFCGTADEETALLEKLKYQHELIEIERKAYEDAEFHQAEETINKEVQRDELTKLFEETKQKLSIKQNELHLLRASNRSSFVSSVMEIKNLERIRQSLLSELQKCRESGKFTDTLNIPERLDVSNGSASDSEDGKNCDLEDKLRTLSLSVSAAEDAMTISQIKTNSPIDPQLGLLGMRTSETLREIEKNREFLLNEQGVEMLEKERQRVKELQKRVQAAAREEWEAAKRKRTNQCHSLNSVGSEDSSQTISDTPTDSGSSDDTTDKSRALSFGTPTFNENPDGLDTTSYELCQQMRHRQKDLSLSPDETRPVSEGSAYENRASIVTLRDKHALQNNRPLTRYLPVRDDEDGFDLRSHIESSGHQLSLVPTIMVTPVSAKGYLLKLGSRFHNWNKRWFVFDRETRTLSYYIDKTQKKPRGGIHFQAIEEVYVDHLHSVKSPSPKLTFCVKTYNRLFHLVAPSPEAMRIWIDVIFTGAEGYQEFKSGI